MLIISELENALQGGGDGMELGMEWKVEGKRGGGEEGDGGEVR